MVSLKVPSATRISGVKLTGFSYQFNNLLPYFLRLKPGTDAATTIEVGEFSYFEQGQSYPMDGHSVHHRKMSGTVTPLMTPSSFGKGWIDKSSSIRPLIINEGYVQQGVTSQQGYTYYLNDFCPVDDNRELYIGIKGSWNPGETVARAFAKIACVQFDATGKGRMSSYVQRSAFQVACRSLSEAKTCVVTASNLARIDARTNGPSLSYSFYSSVWSKTDYVFPPWPTAEELIEKVHEVWNWPYVYPSEVGVSSDLAKEAVEGQNRFSSNMVAYVKGLPDIGNTIRATLALIADPTDPKNWASEWLSLRFTDRLTIADSKELLESIRSELRRMASFKAGCTTSRASTTRSQTFDYYAASARHCARLVCYPASVNDAMSGIKKLYEWDVWPTLENMWDMIPFSFVVDWFTNLSTVLNNVDMLVYRQYLRCRLWEQSRKITITPTLSRFNLSGSLTITDYSRDGGQVIPDFGILEGWDPSLPSLTNLVDSASLLIQLSH